MAGRRARAAPPAGGAGGARAARHPVARRRLLHRAVAVLSAIPVVHRQLAGRDGRRGCPRRPRCRSLRGVSVVNGRPRLRQARNSRLPPDVPPTRRAGIADVASRGAIAPTIDSIHAHGRCSTITSPARRSPSTRARSPTVRCGCRCWCRSPAGSPPRAALRSARGSSARWPYGLRPLQLIVVHLVGYVQIVPHLTGGLIYISAGSHELVGCSPTWRTDAPRLGSVHYAGASWEACSLLTSTGARQARVYLVAA